MPKNEPITCQRFHGWIFICPTCGDKEYIDEEEITFNPADDQIHLAHCLRCKKDFELEVDE